MLIVVQRIACTSLPAAAPVFRAAMRWFIGFAAACWHAVLQNVLRSSAYFFIFRGPTGRTYTCCQRRQVRDLIIAQTGGRPLLSACHVSGSEGRRRGDSLRNLFAPQLQSDERNSKNHWFLAAFFPPFLPLLEEMGPPEASKRKAGRSLRPKVTRARGRGTLPAGGRYSSAGGGKKIVRSGKKILIFPVLSCKI